MRNRRLAVKSETLRTLTLEHLVRIQGGKITETEPWTACGMCYPFTYITCNCARLP